MSILACSQNSKATGAEAVMRRRDEERVLSAGGRVWQGRASDSSANLDFFSDTLWNHLEGVEETDDVEWLLS